MQKRKVTFSDDTLASVDVVFAFKHKSSLNMKISRRRLADYVKTLHQKRAAREARLFFFIQPIKSSICGVVVDVAFVKS